MLRIILLNDLCVFTDCFSSPRYIEAMAHCASTRHPAAIVDDLHAKVLRAAVQSSKTTFSENVRTFRSVERGRLSILHVYTVSRLGKTCMF